MSRIYLKLVLRLKNEKIDIIKIGGSTITVKKKYRVLRKKSLTLICEELAQWNKKCIIVHGAGSFGHIIASKYSIQQGFSDQEQLKGLLQIRKDMIELTETITSCLISKGMKAFSFQTSALVFEKEDGYSFYFDPIKKALSLGFCPILSGDILFNETKGFRIYSGDALINLLVQNFDVDRVIFISDVDGLYLKDTEMHQNKLVDYIDSKSFERSQISDLSTEDLNDVTGRMKGKISEIKSILKHVQKVILVNGFYPTRLKQIREGKRFIGSVIIKENST